jgi:hypothetical protein
MEQKLNKMISFRKFEQVRVRAALAGSVLVLVLVVAGCAVSDITTPESETPGGVVATGVPGALPDVANKPTPAEITFQGCPAEGDGGDPVLNRLKNRIDNGTYLPVQFDALEKLKWPTDTERKRHASWSASDTAQIERYEGIPLAVEGFLEGAKEEGPETPNCHGADLPQHDFHIWLTKTAGEDRTRSIVVEMTPRVRPQHPAWRVDVLTRVAASRARVRVSGWMMYDPEHPEQLNQTRGTLWEIHPITQVEVQQQGQWITLDDYGR